MRSAQHDVLAVYVNPCCEKETHPQDGSSLFASFCSFIHVPALSATSQSQVQKAPLPTGYNASMAAGSPLSPRTFMGFPSGSHLSRPEKPSKKQKNGTAWHPSLPEHVQRHSWPVDFEDLFSFQMVKLWSNLKNPRKKFVRPETPKRYRNTRTSRHIFPRFEPLFASQ
jgi:hypothetical protein